MTDERPQDSEHPESADHSDEADGSDASDRLEELLAEHRDTGEAPEAAPADPYDPFADIPDAEADEDEDDNDGLPDAPLFALLRVLEEEITPPRIDRVWVFPPRRVEVAETAVVVVAAFPEQHADRRRVFAAHYTAMDDSDEHRLTVDEFGTAPTERVSRLVEEVVERIKDAPTDAPRSMEIGGRERVWAEALHSLAEKHLEDRHRNRRLR